MKKEIHPHYSEMAFKCACGSAVNTKSTLKGDKDIDICSACHPFFTGKHKFVDSAGRVEKFRKKYADASKIKKEAAVDNEPKEETVPAT